MKKITAVFSLLTLAIVMSFSACKRDTGPQVQPSTQKTPINLSAQSKKYIYYADGDGWGRESSDCNGWGLCKFRDCWFCEVEELDVHVGTIEFDDETNEGFLIIKLDPSEAIQDSAIANQWTFYVDQDIYNPNSTLHKGAYAFDSTVGSYGGYRIPITIKP